MEKKETLRAIWKNEQNLKENLLSTPDAKDLWEKLIELMESMPHDSIYYLRYQKIRKQEKLGCWYADSNGYPTGNPWRDQFEKILNIFNQYEAEKTLKSRKELKDFFIESRVNGPDGDQHILVGKKDGSAEKAHIIIDGKTGEIRVEEKEDNHPPEEVFDKIETILTRKDGSRIRTTRSVIEEL